MSQYKIKLKINKDLAGYKAGSIIEVNADKSGNARDIYWARRLEESAIDGCVEIVAPKKAETKNKFKSETE